MSVTKRTINVIQNYRFEKRSLADETLSECQTGWEMEIKRNKVESTSKNESEQPTPRP
jgi:hypothetical protein